MDPSGQDCRFRFKEAWTKDALIESIRHRHFAKFDHPIAEAQMVDLPWPRRGQNFRTTKRPRILATIRSIGSDF